MWRAKRISIGSVFTVIALSIGGLADSNAQAVDNREIYLLANAVADEVEQIREFMGQPYDDSPRLPASEVTRSELFFQSRTLFRKANRLAQQFDVAEAESAAAAPEGEIEPAHVFDVISAAEDQIGRVKALLGIEGDLELIRRESSISDTGIFMTIIDINRQLNLLLDLPMRPSDVFEQVAFVNTFAGGIIEQLSPGSGPIGLPDAGGHRRPADVYSKLLQCLELVSRIASRIEGVDTMSVSARRNIPDDIAPGHVYDIAVILVADVATLAVALDTQGADLDLPEPELIFPTQVYQRASLLEQQLIRIEAAL